MSDNPSLIFSQKQEFLFIFGGYGSRNEPVSTYEVLDISSGIWRQFEGDAQKLGQKCFNVAHALPMPGKRIFQLSHGCSTVRQFSITEMSTMRNDDDFNQLLDMSLPEELQSQTFCSV